MREKSIPDQFLPSCADHIAGVGKMVMPPKTNSKGGCVRFCGAYGGVDCFGKKRMQDALK